MNIINELLGKNYGRVTLWRVGNTKMRAMVDNKNRIMSTISFHTLEDGHPTLSTLTPCNLVTTNKGVFLVGLETDNVFDTPREVDV